MQVKELKSNESSWQLNPHCTSLSVISAKKSGFLFNFYYIKLIECEQNLILIFVYWIILESEKIWSSNYLLIHIQLVNLNHSDHFMVITLKDHLQHYLYLPNWLSTRSTSRISLIKISIRIYFDMFKFEPKRLMISLSSMVSNKKRTNRNIYVNDSKVSTRSPSLANSITDSLRCWMSDSIWNSAPKRQIITIHSKYG